MIGWRFLFVIVGKWNRLHAPRLSAAIPSVPSFFPSVWVAIETAYLTSSARPGKYEFIMRTVELLYFRLEKNRATRRNGIDVTDLYNGCGVSLIMRIVPHASLPCIGTLARMNDASPRAAFIFFLTTWYRNSIYLALLVTTGKKTIVRSSARCRHRRLGACCGRGVIQSPDDELFPLEKFLTLIEKQNEVQQDDQSHVQV